MLLRALGILVLSTGLAAAQTPGERTSRGPNRDVRADRTRLAAQTPAERASRGLNRDTRRDTRADRARDVAQSPAERVSRSLERDMRGDRFRDAAQDARGRDTPGRNTPTRPEVQQFEPQRQTLRPDVGRPEQDGRLSTSGTSGQLPSMGPNPQR